MSKFFLQRLALFSMLSLLFLCPVGAESIRGLLSEVIDLSNSELEGHEFSLGLEELVAVIPGEKATFLSNLELILRIPPLIQDRADSFILLVYKRITPTPNRSIRRYQGIEEAHFVLPNRPRLYINIPLVQGGNNASPKGNGPDILNLSQPLMGEDFPLILIFLPLSKGIPPDMEANPLSIKAIPTWNNQGALVLSFDSDEIRPEETSITIDKEPTLWSPKMILPSGIHLLEIEAEDYHRFSTDIAIQEAETTRIEIPMVSKKATLSFEAPEEAIVFLDGERIDLPPGSSMKAEEGVHTATILLNDYRVSKQFSVKSGENLRVSLFLDILIKDD